MDTDQRKRAITLRRYVDSAVKAGLALLTVAIGLLALGAALGGTGGVIVATVGAALCTVAILNFLFEPYQKDALVREVLERVGVQQSIIQAELRHVGATRDLALPALLGQSHSVRALPLDPLRWPTDQFRHLLVHATSHAAAIEVFVPAPESAAVQPLADRLRTGVSELGEWLERLPDELGKVWDEEQRHPNATLRVMRYTGVPGIGLLLCEACAILEVGFAVRMAALDLSSQALVYAPDSDTAAWVRKQLSFAGDTLPPTAAGARPLQISQPRGGQPHPKAPSSLSTQNVAQGPSAADDHVAAPPAATESDSPSSESVSRKEPRYGS